MAESPNRADTEFSDILIDGREYTSETPTPEKVGNGVGRMSPSVPKLNLTSAKLLKMEMMGEKPEVVVAAPDQVIPGTGWIITLSAALVRTVRHFRSALTWDIFTFLSFQFFFGCVVGASLLVLLPLAAMNTWDGYQGLMLPLEMFAVLVAYTAGEESLNYLDDVASERFGRRRPMFYIGIMSFMVGLVLMYFFQITGVGFMFLLALGLASAGISIARRVSTLMFDEGCVAEDKGFFTRASSVVSFLGAAFGFHYMKGNYTDVSTIYGMFCAMAFAITLLYLSLKEQIEYGDFQRSVTGLRLMSLSILRFVYLTGELEFFKLCVPIGVYCIGAGCASLFLLFIRDIYHRDAFSVHTFDAVREKKQVTVVSSPLSAGMLVIALCIPLFRGYVMGGKGVFISCGWMVFAIATFILYPYTPGMAPDITQLIAIPIFCIASLAFNSSNRTIAIDSLTNKMNKDIALTLREVIQLVGYCIGVAIGCTILIIHAMVRAPTIDPPDPYPYENQIDLYKLDPKPSPPTYYYNGYVGVICFSCLMFIYSGVLSRR